MSTAEPPIVRLGLERPDQPEIIALIDALDAYQKPMYPAESHHGVDLRALRDPTVLFAVARSSDGAAVGCGAVWLTPAFAELKRMFVPPAKRGLGIGRRLLQFIEAQAQERGATRLTLETGYLQTEALRLYERSGYARCEPFGSYVADPNSVFMAKNVEVAGRTSQVSVWRARVADVDDVAPLFDAYRQFYGREPDLPLARAFLRERLERGESVVLVARDEAGRACGFTQLYPSFSSARAARIAILNDLFVAGGSRRQGVGRLLLDAATRWARSEGVARLKLSTALSNHPAQRLYEALGWVRETAFHEYNLSVRP